MSDWPQPCEKAFRACAPAVLAAWIDSGTLDPADTALALEVLAEYGPAFAVTVARGLTHASPIPREAAIYALIEVLRHMSEHDENGGVRDAAGDVAYG